MQSNMKLHIGTKALKARPMTKQEYCAYRGWAVPGDEDPTEEGYLVEYLDGGQGNHHDHVGYISWSPKDVFEASYASDGEMNFGHALNALGHGSCVARSGWNGKGMFVYRVPSGRYKPNTSSGWVIAAHQDDGLVPYTAYLAIKSVDGSVSPWAPSQTDVLAKDWGIVEPAEAMDRLTAAAGQ